MSVLFEITLPTDGGNQSVKRNISSVPVITDSIGICDDVLVFGPVHTLWTVGFDSASQSDWRSQNTELRLHFYI